jgi:hypothetical protein
MLLKFVAPNDCGQFFTVKRALPITTVEYVRFVGCKWSFYPGVGPILFPRFCNISARKFCGGSIKASPPEQGESLPRASLLYRLNLFRLSGRLC